MEKLDFFINQLKDALLNVNRTEALALFERFYFEQNDYDVLEKIIVKSLEDIGTDWENGMVSLAQVYMSGIICEELIDKHMPKKNFKRQNEARIAIGVLQDHHSLGKRMVYSTLRAGGFEVVDFGYGLSVSELVDKTIENDIDILLISALMLPSALKVREVKEKLTAGESKVKIVTGGAPFRLDPELWKTVGADANGKNASDIVGIIEKMTGGGR